MPVRTIFATFLALFLLSGCQATASAPTFAGAIEDAPGVRVALMPGAPDGFHAGEIGDVYRAHWAGQDVWLFASEEALRALLEGDAFVQWLQAAKALIFHTPSGPVWYVPARADEDLLALVDAYQLQSWADAAQLAHLWQARGDNARKQNDFESAIAAYDRALALDPNFVDAYIGKGAALLGLGRAEEALHPLLTAVSLDPDAYWAQRLLGNAYLNLQRYRLAIAPLSRAYLLQPQQTQTLIAVALAVGRGGNPQQALQILAKAAARITDPALLEDIQTLHREFTGGGD